jgi:hypothetical protein
MSLIYGIGKGEPMNIFWAIIIIPGVFVLVKVRKKDWKKHWEGMEEEQRIRKAIHERKNLPPDKPKEG